jgi:hypothetical protein
MNTKCRSNHLNSSRLCVEDGGGGGTVSGSGSRWGISIVTSPDWGWEGFSAEGGGRQFTRSSLTFFLNSGLFLKIYVFKGSNVNENLSERSLNYVFIEPL